jgi:hypothetical protein
MMAEAAADFRSIGEPTVFLDYFKVLTDPQGFLRFGWFRCCES